MDGFAANEGMMVVGTTNHPERLDPAILERPSRFDRKYHFELPDIECRRAYLQMCSGSLEPELQLSEEQIGVVAEEAEGFSFAYLKELFLSSMMDWMKHPGREPMGDIVRRQVAALRGQMTSEPDEPAQDLPDRYQAMRQMRMQGRYRAR